MTALKMPRNARTQQMTVFDALHLSFKKEFGESFTRKKAYLAIKENAGTAKVWMKVATVRKDGYMWREAADSWFNSEIALFSYRWKYDR